MATTTAHKPGQRLGRRRKGYSQRIAFDSFNASPFDALALMLWRSHCLDMEKSFYRQSAAKSNIILQWPRHWHVFNAYSCVHKRCHGAAIS
jgi:hypothetical protein